MATVAACPKCGSRELSFDNSPKGFGCGECDWIATPEHLMEL